MNPVLKLLVEGGAAGASAGAEEVAPVSAAQLASAAGLSEAEVSAQLSELKARGVFLGWRPVLDWARVAQAGGANAPGEAAGNATSLAAGGGGGVAALSAVGAVRAVIEVRLTPERGGGFNRLAKRISLFDEVESCYLMSGGYDLLVFVKGASMQKVAGFVSEKLSTISGVLSTATHFQLRCYKDQGFILDPELGEAQRLSVAP